MEEAEEVPDFGRFLEEEDQVFGANDGQFAEQGASKDGEEAVREREMAEAVMEMLVGGGEAAFLENGRGRRRLSFQGGLTQAARVSATATMAKAEEEEEKPGAPRKMSLPGLSLLSKGKSLISKKGTSGPGVAKLQTFASVKKYFAWLADHNSPEMLQAFVFDDFFVVARHATAREGAEGKPPLSIIWHCQISQLSLRDVGNGYYTFEDHSVEDEQLVGSDQESGAGASDGEGQAGSGEIDETGDEAKYQDEESRAKGMELGAHMIEVVDNSSGEKLIVNTGDQGNKQLWIQHIVAACRKAAPESRKSQVGWEHTILRGTQWSAAREGNTYQVGRLMLFGRTCGESVVSTPDENGMTALHYAAQFGHTLIVRQLLAAEPGLGQELDNNLRTPLHCAAAGLSTFSVKALLSAGADPELRDLQERTPLLVAIAQSTDVSIQDDQGYQDECSSDKRKQSKLEIVELLCDFGVDLDHCDVSGRDALSMALMQENQALAQALFAHGAKTDRALGALCEQRPLQVPFLAKLLGWGANPNQRIARRGKSLLTPLHVLLEPPAVLPTSDLQDAVETLVSFGARPELADAEGVSAAALLQARGIRCDDSMQRWGKKEEPQSVQALLMAHPYRVPYASIAWEDDGGVQECRLCCASFTMVVRKHHCRRCGKVVCNNCCNKLFTLRTDKDPGSKQKVCGPCFNSLCRSMTVVANELQVSAGLTVGEAGRSLLFGDKKREPAAVKEDEAGASAGKVQDTLRRAQESLAERGERLNRLTEKSEQLNNNAANFGSLAKQLREREEKKASWFGGLF